MTTYAILKTLHLLGVLGLFTSIGIILSECSDKCRRRATMMHGLSLLLLLLLGFAILKKPPMDQHWWQAKLGVWLFLGAVPVLGKRRLAPAPVLLFGSILAGVLAAWLAIAKPF